MNEEYTSDLEEIRALLPVRMTKPGVKPTMKSKWVNQKEILADDDWIYPPPGMYTERQRRTVMGHVAEIGTRALFEKHSIGIACPIWSSLGTSFSFQ